MIHELGDFPKYAPNPPPWSVTYVNDQCEGYEAFTVLPVAHTVGLEKLGYPELMIRKSSPGQAAYLLDIIGIWFMDNHNKVCRLDEFLVFGEKFKVIPVVIGNTPWLRLSWYKDDDEDFASVEDFKVACVSRRIPNSF